MQINRKDMGYTIYSRLEEALRSWISATLLTFGAQWASKIPVGVWEKAEDRGLVISDRYSLEDPNELLEETDIPDLLEIVCYKNSFSLYFQNNNLTQEQFSNLIASLYDLRCKIAHVKQSFNAIDLDFLIEIAKSLIPTLSIYGEELSNTIECIQSNKGDVVIQIPTDFFIGCDDKAAFLHNLPPSDYDPDGGFIGRKDALKKIKSLVLGDLDRVITISGAGGVGKTALAHKFCFSLFESAPVPFDAIVWISAKEEKLTLTGIEPIEPTVRNYEEVLDNILYVYGLVDSINLTLYEKEEFVNILLNDENKGLLLVVDNLETIQDARIIEFIKDFPRPNKVLITSRMGLGEVERRYSLKELSKIEAVQLIRTVAREKGVDSLIRQSDETLYLYAKKMSMYPLAIKWVVGQVALGKDINQIVDGLASSSGEIARFCFDHIYENLLTDNAKLILCCLAASDDSLTRGVLTHVSGLTTGDLDDALRDLSLASLVIQDHDTNNENKIITKYTVLPLTLGYLRAKSKTVPDLWRGIQTKMELLSSQIEEAKSAGTKYRYALQDLGATTVEERIAASWALTGYQSSQMGDYNASIKAFKRAIEIAPNFSRIYRNWATVESAEGYHERANELMQKATNLNPKDPTLWFVWGNMEKRRSHLDKARRYFLNALDLSPNDGAVLGGLGEVEKRKGNYQEAQTYFMKALSIPQELRSYKHEVITHTAIADNLRRWAESFWKENQRDEALLKGRLAYDHASQAIQMAGSDYRVQDALREAALDLAMMIVETEGIDEAYPLFKKAIADKPLRTKERKFKSKACYYFANKLLNAGRTDEAKNYYQIGEKSTKFRTEFEKRRYEALRVELFERKHTGIIQFIPKDKSFGFIQFDDAQGEDIFFHRTALIPQFASKEFKNLRGSRVSFTVTESDRGLKAINVRLI